MRLILRLISVGLLLSLLLLQPVWAQQLKETKRVLVLHSEDKANPAHELTDVGISSAFRSNTLFDIQLYIEYLDGSRFSGPAHDSAMVDYLNRKYTGTKIDSIIAVYPRAVNFLMQGAGKIFPGVPIVASEIDRGTAENLERSPWRSLVTGVILGDNVADLLKVAFRLRPGTKRVALVAGAAPTDAYGETILRNGLKPYEEKIDLVDLTKLPMQEILDRVRSLPPDTIVLYSSIFKDGAGKFFVPRDALSLISTAANGPLFNPYDGTIGYGNVGGRLISFDLQGGEAAALAIRIMNGESPSSIPFGGERAYVDLYDGRELRRWNLRENDLPAGSIVINREPTFWEFKYHLLGGLLFLVGQSFLIFFLLAQKNRRRAAEEDLRRKKEELDKFFSMNLDLLCIADIEGYFLRLNPAWEKILGFSLAELMSKPFLELVHSEDVAATRKAIRTLSDGGRLLDFTNRYRRKDGTYRQMMWSAAAAGDLIYAAARDVTERIEAEAAIQERERELQSLTGRLILGQEAERRHLARELHDDLSQRLAALAIEVGKMETRVDDRKETILQHLRGLRDKTIRIAADVHNLSRRLHPSILEDLGLTKAIESECARFGSQEGIEVAFNTENIPAALPKDIALSIYRIVQESLTNIAKHACARCAAVRLSASATNLHLSIRDDGLGFDAAEARKRPGLGLSSIRERVRLVDGRHRIISEPEKGTAIEVSVPLKSETPKEGSGDLTEGQA